MSDPQFTDEEYAVLIELRRIPQRNSHYMYLHGDQVAIAESLRVRGLVERSEGMEKGSITFRLNKLGREELYREYDRRGGVLPERNK